MNWAVTGSGASPANAADFNGGVLPSGSVHFAPNSATSQPITILVKGDTTNEPDETFAVTLSNATGTGVSLGDSIAATGTIVNDDNVAGYSRCH